MKHQIGMQQLGKEERSESAHKKIHVDRQESR